MNEETKELFLKYEAVRKAGMWNMIVDADDAMIDMKLNPRHKSDRDKYYDIIRNYDAYTKAWL